MGSLGDEELVPSAASLFIWLLFSFFFSYLEVIGNVRNWLLIIGYRKISLLYNQDPRNIFEKSGFSANSKHDSYKNINKSLFPYMEMESMT